MEPKESPDNSQTFAEIVGNKSPLRNSWWLQYQSEEEEVALTLAIQKSLEEEKQVMVILHSASLDYQPN